ncbi:hypothetical protein L345_05151, partial [Ophiophagus hannah]
MFSDTVSYKVAIYSHWQARTLGKRSDFNVSGRVVVVFEGQYRDSFLELRARTANSRYFLGAESTRQFPSLSDSTNRVISESAGYELKVRMKVAAKPIGECWCVCAQSTNWGCRFRLFWPGYGASPPPRHGSPCPCSSPLSERNRRLLLSSNSAAAILQRQRSKGREAGREKRGGQLKTYSRPKPSYARRWQQSGDPLDQAAGSAPVRPLLRNPPPVTPAAGPTLKGTGLGRVLYSGGLPFPLSKASAGRGRFLRRCLATSGFGQHAVSECVCVSVCVCACVCVGHTQSTVTRAHLAWSMPGNGKRGSRQA